MKQIISLNQQSEAANGITVYNLIDAPERIQFAAIRDDERLCQAFMNAISNATTDVELITASLRAFLRMEYRPMMRGNYRAFCNSFCNLYPTTVAVECYEDGTPYTATVSVDGMAGEEIDMRLFMEIAECDDNIFIGSDGKFHNGCALL